METVQSECSVMKKKILFSNVIYKYITKKLYCYKRSQIFFDVIRND